MAHSVPAKRKTNNNNFQDNNIGDNNIDIDEFAGSRDGGWGWIVVIASLLIHIISKYNVLLGFRLYNVSSIFSYIFDRKKYS